jgi:hypothetical protein
LGKVLVLVILLLGVVALGDVETRIFAQRQLEHRIDGNVRSAGAHVSISSFPFLGRLAADGTVPKIKTHVPGVTSGPFTFDSIDVTVNGVHVDRSALFNSRRVQVQRIDSGTVVADMTEAALDKVLGGAAVSLGNGVAQIRVGPVTATAVVSVVNNQLHVTASGVPINVTLPKLTLIPCAVNAVVVTGHLRLSCAFQQVPAALLTTTAKV